MTEIRYSNKTARATEERFIRRPEEKGAASLVRWPRNSQGGAASLRADMPAHVDIEALFPIRDQPPAWLMSLKAKCLQEA
jgi:hypothetical protein